MIRALPSNFFIIYPYHENNDIIIQNFEKGYVSLNYFNIILFFHIFLLM